MYLSISGQLTLHVNVMKNCGFPSDQKIASASRVVRRRLGLWQELRKRVVKEGGESSLLVTSSSGIPVANDHENSHGEMARCANASNCLVSVSVVRNPVSSGVPPSCTQNQVPDTCETSYNATNQRRSPHVAIKFPETCSIQTDVPGTS
nr:hypothetical protein [Tanacetum cinerariifolium]